MQNNDSQRSFDTATCPRNATMMPTPWYLIYWRIEERVGEIVSVKVDKQFNKSNHIISQ